MNQGARVGYIRVSSTDQNTDRQLDGILDLDRTFTEAISGGTMNRPQLQAMLDYVRDGDTIVCHSLDRMARNLDDLRHIVQTLTKRGVKVEFLKEHLTFTGDDSPMSNLLLSVMGAFAEFERSIIKERQREGIRKAQQRGVYKGGKKPMPAARVAEIREYLAAHPNKSEVAKHFEITRQTLYNALKRTDVAPAA